MKMDEKLVILTSENGLAKHLKMQVDNGNKRTSFNLDKGVKHQDAYVVLFGKEIAKQALYVGKNDYKVRFQANEQIDVLLVDGDEIYFGGTPKAPALSDLLRRIDWADGAQKSIAKIDNDKEEIDKAKGGIKREAVTAENPVQNEGKFDDNFEEESPQNTRDKIDVCSSKKEVQKGDEPRTFCQDVDCIDRVKKQGESGANEANTAGAKCFSFDDVHFDGSNFYLSVKPQIDELFVCFPESEELTKAVPNSRWVQVEAVDGFYVVGLVYDCDTVSYICYGVPSKESKTPPDEIKNLCVWLPISCENGYWIIYQDALTGKCLK